MFRLNGAVKEGNRIRAEVTVSDASPEKTRTEKVLSGLSRICGEFDLPVPIWLDFQIREFQRSSHTRFGRESFVEETDFDYLEIQVLEE